MKYQAWIELKDNEWSYNEFNTLQDAMEYVMKNNYGFNYKITKSID